VSPAPEVCELRGFRDFWRGAPVGIVAWASREKVRIFGV